MFLFALDRVHHYAPKIEFDSSVPDYPFLELHKSFEQLVKLGSTFAGRPPIERVVGGT